MRYLGLDLGTKTLGVAITDETKTLARILKVIRFPEYDYESACEELLKILAEFDIESIALGLPKNMNNTMGFASERSLNFKKLLEEKTDIPIFLIDERLSTVEAESILINSDTSRSKRKKIIDGLAAVLILEIFMAQKENKNEQ